MYYKLGRNSITYAFQFVIIYCKLNVITNWNATALSALRPANLAICHSTDNGILPMYTSWYTCCRVITVTSTTKTRKSSFFLCVPNGNVDIIYSGAKNTQRPDNITMHATITCIDSFSHSVDCFHSVSHRRVSFHNLGHSSGSLYSLGLREKIQAYVVHFMWEIQHSSHK